jgi:hypothetical protein
MQHADNGNGPPPMRQQVNVLIGLAQILAAPLELAFRKPGTCGSKHFAGRAALGILAAPLLIGLIPGAGLQRAPRHEYVAAGAFGFCILALAVHTSKRKEREKQGSRVHSLYTGDSIFGADPWRAKLSTEPPVAFLLGLLALTVSFGLGAYLMIGGVCLGISASASKAEHDARIRAMRDARIESEIYAGEMRDEE